MKNSYRSCWAAGLAGLLRGVRKELRPDALSPAVGIDRNRLHVEVVLWNSRHEPQHGPRGESYERHPQHPPARCTN